MTLAQHKSVAIGPARVRWVMAQVVEEEGGDDLRCGEGAPGMTAARLRCHRDDVAAQRLRLPLHFLYGEGQR